MYDISTDDDKRTNESGFLLLHIASGKDEQLCNCKHCWFFIQSCSCFVYEFHVAIEER